MSQANLSEKLVSVLNTLKDLLEKIKSYISSCDNIRQDYNQSMQIADQIIQVLEDFKKQAPLYREVKK